MRLPAPAQTMSSERVPRSPVGPEWFIRTVAGTAGELHDRDDFTARELRLCTPTRPAVVLGSAQADDDVDRAAAQSRGLDVVRRRSGGGAVFVDPVESIWVEAWIPRGDPLWTDDVSASMVWFGRAMCEVVAAEVDCTVSTAPFDAGGYGRSICFLSIAPGEVVSTRGKVVGISQRRDRRGARLQAVLFRRWDPARWAVFADPLVSRALSTVAVATVDIEPADLLARVGRGLSRID